MGILEGILYLYLTAGAATGTWAAIECQKSQETTSSCIKSSVAIGALWPVALPQMIAVQGMK